MREGVPSTLHLAEDQAELDFLLDGSGPYGALHERAGVNWREVGVPNCGPVAYLEHLGVLGPGMIAVHGVRLTQEEHLRLASTRTPLCLCPRSNRWIGGQLPDVPSLLEAGVPLCLGTDSLASNDDLDVLGEIALPKLRRAGRAVVGHGDGRRCPRPADGVVRSTRPRAWPCVVGRRRACGCLGG